MIVQTRGARMEVRVASEFGSSAVPTPLQGSGGGFGTVSQSGAYVGVGETAGLPAYGRAVDIICSTTAMLPIVVFQGRDPITRLRAPESWQHELLTGAVNDEQSGFDFWYDISASLTFHGNAYVEKVKAGGRVIALFILDPSSVTVGRDKAGAKSFQVRGKSGMQSVGADKILHVRGKTLGSGLVGLSPIQLYRNRIGTALSQEAWHGSFYKHGAAPGGVIEVPGTLNAIQARQVLTMWSGRHGGALNANRPGLLYNGAKWNATTMNLVDQQFIESQKLTVEDIGRIVGVPNSLLGVDAAKPLPLEQEMTRLVLTTIGPHAARINSAFRADRDLFALTDLYPELQTDALMRADMKTRFDSYLVARQAGWLSGNEIRAEDGRPPVPGLDEIQQTPVGGAPNLQPGSGGAGPTVQEDEE